MIKLITILIFIPYLITSQNVSFLGHSFSIASQNGDYRFISTAPNTVTRFEAARSLAYLAHNPGTGAHFLELSIGDVINAGEMYTVIDIDRYRVEGDDYIDMDTGSIKSDIDLWNLYYANEDRLILQTCIDNGDGRLFVIGEK